MDDAAIDAFVDDLFKFVMPPEASNPEEHPQPVPCRIMRPIDTRVLGWCADEKVWKCGYFMKLDGVVWFKHEGQGPIYGEHEVSHWMPLPKAP